MPGLLIIDDNEDVRKQLRWGLSKEPYQLYLAGSTEEALALQRGHSPAVVTLDLGLPPDAEGTSEGFRALDALLKQDPRVQVIVVTGHHDVENALRAIQGGAYDFCHKPADLDVLKIIIGRAFFLHGLRDNVGPPVKRQGECQGIVGQCPAMLAVFETISKVAASDAPVLVTGESGTGKELVARAIHAFSHRTSMPFVAINCGAIPDNLLEAEFFGYEKGAFTGATQRVQGKVEYADNGTLFLDEIGELPPNLQVKLLRFLQEMVIQRVGGRKDIRVDARIVAATNRDIQSEIASGRFREDLYYRIGVVPIVLPPLRTRGDDILLLARHFLERFARERNHQVKMLSPAATQAMLRHNWPGNVRELENKLRRAVIFASGQHIAPVDLGFDDAMPAEAPAPPRPEGTLKEARNALERDIVLTALEKCSGNIVQASQAIGVSRPTFYDLLRKHGIEI
ncbi:PEP-CTERM-box response regulator transcription factor [Nitratidesulfovibrio sp. SRB-5]|uniref:PEP-CTERM-box response regulator transcription factor n=1 Tax=Nitratidesulfovibrio sp. SRB-5 TaxID=2872636 RepID=UPI001025FDCD|nr:PEP-CTERM-box response regulator transcription factor [Nitratidesulfovibrio sp. SRB-5]MBZ2172997.1 PEP-CTERM-box response regulator transcription factor [Nitratidesulfovibrio sp. SRB-5]RXF78470.1 PEP-CTERM-box response regulator transcription factor [Desulfovibrio sp. DS-1]